MFRTQAGRADSLSRWVRGRTARDGITGRAIQVHKEFVRSKNGIGGCASTIRRSLLGFQPHGEALVHSADRR